MATYDAGNTLAYTVTGLSPNTAYTVTARAYDSVGVRGVDATPLLVTTSVGSAPSTASLSATTSLSAIGHGASTGAGTFTATAALQASSAGDITSGTTDVGNTLACTVTNLLSNTAYGITVRAYDSVGVRGSNSSPLGVTTTIAGATTPGAPTGVTATANGVSGLIVVTWTPPVSDGGSPIIDYQVNAAGYGPITGLSPGYDAVPVAGLTDGTSYTFTVQARNAVGLSAPSAPVSVAPTAVNFHIRVNAGGPAYTDGSGNVWTADNGFTGGTAGADPGGVTPTVDPSLFLWERWGMSQYQFTGLTNGTYHVDLFMAEQAWTGAGQRIFSATANGQAVFTNLDVLSAAGGRFKAITRSINVVVNSGTLTLGFTATVDTTLVNAIHIYLPTTGVSPATASLSAVTSLFVIGHGSSTTGAGALTATAILQASAGGAANQGSAGLAAHATLVAVPVTGGTIDAGNTLAYTIANLLPSTSYSITVRAYDGVGVRGSASAPINVTTLTATPSGAGALVASSRLVALGSGVAGTSASLQAASTLVATTGGSIKPGSTALVANAILFLTATSSGPPGGYIVGGYTGSYGLMPSGAATLSASSTLVGLSRQTVGGTVQLLVVSLLAVGTGGPIKVGSASLAAHANFSASPATGTFGDGTFGSGTFGNTGPVVDSAYLTASSTLFVVGLRTARSSVVLAATSTLAATGTATSTANLSATSALAATADAISLGLASVQLVSTATLTAVPDVSVMIAAASLVATSALFGDPTGPSTRLGSAGLSANSTLFALTVATVRTGSVALVTTPSSLGAIGTRWIYVPPLPPAVFAMPRLIVEIAVAAGPNLNAKETGTANALTLNDPNTFLGTSVLGSSTVWTEITADVLHLDFSYGRSAGPLSDLTQPVVGSANITFENFNGNYDPANPNGTFADGHGGTLLLPLRQVQIRAEWADITHPLWRGYVEEYVPDYGSSPTVVMQCVGPLAILAAAPVLKVDPPLFGGEQPGAQINHILDRIEWPTSLRDIDTGNTVMPAAYFGDNALRLCQDVATAEGGLLFTSAQTGAVTFYDRTRLLNSWRSLSVLAILDDSDANNTIDYLGMTVSYGAATIANSVTMNRVNGMEQTANDATSQAAYGIRALPSAPTNLQLTSDNQTLAVANWYLQQYKDAHLRVSDITVEGLSQHMWPTILDLTLWDRIEVKRKYSASYSFDRQLIVQGITHTIVPYQSWSVKFNTQSPVSASPFNFPQMILNTFSGVGIGCLGYP